MPWKFNPFSVTLDQTGTGGGGGGAQYLDGEVATYNDLPLDGTAAADSAWLVRSASGTWLIGRKPAGIYIRTATAGVSRDADYTYAGIFPDVFSDANFTLYDDGDATKTAQFQLSGITTGTNRTLTVPDASGTIATTADFAAPPAIGNTTPNTGAFTTLTANNGTLTASAPVLDLAQTWNASGVTFTALRVNATNTASAAGSLLAAFQVGGSTVAHVRRDGVVFGGTFSVVNAANVTGMWAQDSGNTIAFPIGNSARATITSSVLGVGNAQAIGWGSGGSATNTLDTQMHRDAADTIAFRRDTNPQIFRLYNTYTDASNHERGFMRWSSNVLQIGTEKAGTGSARALEFVVDGTTRVSINTSGVVSANAGLDVNTDARLANGFGLTIAQNRGVWWTDGNTNSGTRDVFLARFAARQLALRLGASDPMAFQIYNAYTSTTNFERLNLRWASNECIIDAEAGSAGGTLRGIKIGSATSSLLGFYGATPVDQPATVADPAGGGTIDAEARTAIGEIIDRLQELGLIA